MDKNYFDDDSMIAISMLITLKLKLRTNVKLIDSLIEKFTVKNNLTEKDIGILNKEIDTILNIISDINSWWEKENIPIKDTPRIIKRIITGKIIKEE